MKFKKIIFYILSYFLLTSPLCAKSFSLDSLNQYNDSVINLIKRTSKLEKKHVLINDLLNKNKEENFDFNRNFVQKHYLLDKNYQKDSLTYSKILFNHYSKLYFFVEPDTILSYIKGMISYLRGSTTPELQNMLYEFQLLEATVIGRMGYALTELRMLSELYPKLLKSNNTLLLYRYNFNLALIYYQYNETQKSLDFLYKVIHEKKLTQEVQRYKGVSYILLASNYLKLNQTDSIRKYNRMAAQFLTRKVLSHIIYISRYHSINAYLLALDKNFVEAYKNIDSAYNIAVERNNDGEILYSNFMKARCFALQKRYDEAIDLYKYILANSPVLMLNIYKSYILRNLLDVYKQTGKIEKVYDTYDELLEFQEEETQRTKEMQIEELDYNFKLNEKLNEIEKLRITNEKAEVTKQRNRIFIVSLVILMVFLAGISLLIHKNNVRKRQLAMNQYALLEARLEEERQNKKIDEMQLLKQVEDRERNRIANDLHDSLGGLLSSVKTALYSLQERQEDNTEDKAHIDQILGYVGECKQELQRIVYNLTPLVVEKFGFVEAIKQYCKKLQNEQLKIDLQLISVPANIVMEDEIMLYRIIQEVLYNITKHAHASHALVQIQSNKEGMMMITIEDNGQGISADVMEVNAGLGLRSLYSRVSSLKGKINIESEKGQGTVVNIICYPKLKDIV